MKGWTKRKCLILGVTFALLDVVLYTMLFVLKIRMPVFATLNSMLFSTFLSVWFLLAYWGKSD